MHGKFGVSIEVKRASRPLMNLKNNSNLIGPCDRLLQEDITLLLKISRTFHETSQSNMAIDSVSIYAHLSLTVVQIGSAWLGHISYHI